MDAGVWSILLIANHWAHALAATLWVGGGLVYLLVIVPAARRLREEGHETGVAAWMNRQAGRVLGGGIGVFVLTGGVMTLQRLSEPEIGVAYIGVLAAKILLSAAAFALVWKRGELFTGISGGPLSGLLPGWLRSKAGLAVALGALAYLLAIVLQRIVESALLAS